MIRCYSYNRINDIDTKYIQDLQETLLTKNYCTLELDTLRNPIQQIYTNRPTRKIENNISEIHGFVMPIIKLGKIIPTSASLINCDRHIEKVYYDKDLQAISAIVDLFLNKVSIDKINKTLSVGMLGIKKNRKLTPTKWSITAVDKIISNQLTKNIEFNKSINEIEIYSYSHFHNDYYVIIIPNDLWSFEYIEIWKKYNNEKIPNIITTDFEHTNSKIDKNIINPVSKGAFFASKLGVFEHLNKVKKIGSVIIIRIIHPSYTIPLGVWQVRQGIRQALSSEKNKTIVKSIEEGDFYLYRTAKGNIHPQSISKSKTNVLLKQKKITQFFKF